MHPYSFHSVSPNRLALGVAYATRAVLIGYIAASVLSAGAIHAGAPGAPPADVVKDLGEKILSVVFSVAGVVSALAFAANGIKLVLSSVGESSRGSSSALLSFGICAVGVALAFMGPTLAENVISAITVKKSIYIP